MAPPPPTATAAPTTAGGERIAIVAAGAGARGAYEAGALAEALLWLEGQGLAPTIFVGTSAGAINAALMASHAHLGARAMGDAMLEFWGSVSIDDVIRSPLRTAPELVAQYAAQVAGLPGAGVASLFDSTPMLPFAEGLFEAFGTQLRRNVKPGLVDALAVVATGQDDRTRVFCQLASGTQLPPSQAARAIDYRRARITAAHVVASSAIPVLLRPVEIGGRWYTDGGARLNVPLAPAIALGCTKVVVVATHPDAYTRPARIGRDRAPDVVDAAAQLVGSVLADRMVEDLLTLDKLNGIAVARGARPAVAGDAGQAPPPAEPRLIPRAFVGPQTRARLGELATEQYPLRTRRGRPFADDLALVRRVLGPREPSGGDLLSYLFFDPAFTEPAIALGRADAKRRLGWRPSR